LIFGFLPELLLLLDLLEMDELSSSLSFDGQWDCGWPFFQHLKQGLSLKYSLSNSFFSPFALSDAFFASSFFAYPAFWANAVPYYPPSAGIDFEYLSKNNKV
jgi:hypothetical protein